MKKMLTFLLAGVMMLTVAVTAMAAAPQAITLGVNTDGIALADAVLTPGEEYRFPLNITMDDGSTRPLVDTDLDSYSLRVNNIGTGNTITNFKIIEISSVYYVAAEVKMGWPVDQTEEQFTIKYIKKTDGKTLSTINVDFKTGYAAADDAYINTLAADDYIQVDPNAPVFTKEQLDKIAKLNNYKKVTFTNGTWMYTVNVTDMDNINLLNNQNAINDILNKYQDNQFTFLTFPAGSEFPVSGTMSVDVANMIDGFNGHYYVYKYDGYKLTKITSTFNEDDYTLNFNVSALGRFIITDKEITDTVIVSTGTLGTKTNPSTGADTSMVMAIAVMALMSTAALSIKKSK